MMSDSMPVPTAMPAFSSAQMMPQPMPFQSAMPGASVPQMMAPSMPLAPGGMPMQPSSKESLSKPAAMGGKQAKKAKAPVTKLSLNELLENQNPQGFWPDTSKSTLDKMARSGDCFAFPSAATLRAELQQLKLTCSVDQVLATLIALYLLQECYEDDNSQWTLVATKAKNYLK